MKKVIALIIIGTIFLFMGLNMFVKPPDYPNKRDFANVSVQDEKVIKEDITSLDFDKSSYKIKDIHTDKTANDVELLFAEEKYSLISTQDFADVFFKKVKVDEDTITLNDKVFFILNEKKVYTLESEKMLAEYKISYPAIKVHDKVYLPLKTVAGILGYEVRFDNDNGYVYVDSSISVDDANLIFIGYKEI